MLRTPLVVAGLLVAGCLGWGAAVNTASAAEHGHAKSAVQFATYSVAGPSAVVVPVGHHGPGHYGPSYAYRHAGPPVVYRPTYPVVVAPRVIVPYRPAPVVVAPSCPAPVYSYPQNGIYFGNQNFSFGVNF